MATAKKVKKREGENLSSSSIESVIALLEQDKPITKKEACERLNITYNTSRLNNIIEEYKNEKARTQQYRAAKRGKPAEPFEIQEVIKGYLEGVPMKTIADQMYRPSSFVKEIVDRVGVPQRGVGDYFKPDLLPEPCIAESFEKGQVVWSCRYNALAIVIKEEPSNREYKVYQIYVLETIDEVSPLRPFSHITGYGGRYAAQAAFDLGSLEHLKDYGVDVYKPLRPYFPNMLAGR